MPSLHEMPMSTFGNQTIRSETGTANHLSEGREYRMKKSISLLALASILAAGSAYASGYRIPEQSPDSVAKAGAHIASATGANSSYYNPANMAWAENAWLGELDFTYIHLTSIDYQDYRSPALSGSSEDENFLLPTFFAVSPDYRNFRFGLSFTGPYGLAKRWNDWYPALTAKEFELKVFDLNPVVSYKINDYLSLAGGVRMIMATATARNGGTNPSNGVTYQLDLEGDWSVDWGYNLAVAVRPCKGANISATYRSNVDMGLSGDAFVATSSPMPLAINTTGDVDLPAPAVFTLAASYSWEDLTVEVAWDRTFWDEYEALDFNFGNPLLEASLFGAPRPKDWDNTDAFRISASYKFNEAFTGMAGFAVDQNPVPEEYLSFELPDSDAWLYAIGVRYAVNEKTDVTLGALYDYKESREVTNSIIVGEFTDAAAILISAGVSYKF
jgi:long-chain fatty acid transport protein